MKKIMFVMTCLILTILSALTGCVEDEQTESLDSIQSQLSADEACLEGIDATDTRGPFSYTSRRSGMVNLLVPQVSQGCRVPVVHFANGTYATCSMYQSVLNAFASHGFLTVCYESMNTGAGTQGVEAIETARRLYPDLVSDKIGSMGHSQGGQAAFTVLARAEDKWGDSFAYAGLAIEPASGFGSQPLGTTWQSMYRSIDSPMFMFSGTADYLVPAYWVQMAFNALSNDVEAYNWRHFGSTHIPVPQSEVIEVGIPWFRWKLLGDNEACRDFYDLRSDFSWTVRDEQNRQTCE
jgi:hypothetical protein